jgi:hypothetical protein
LLPLLVHLIFIKILPLFRYIITLFLLAPVANLCAQRFGGNPPSLKWKQINTDTARIIFPTGLDKQARDVTGIIHHLVDSSQHSIGGQLKKINIVLQNQTLISNGYVALGPYRSEFFLTPRQDNFELGTLPWHKMLALHEYRHVQQYNNFRRGISRIAYYLFGEQGQALANGISVPDWFFEGDAVYQETIMSKQGRGKIPYFFNPYHSLWAADKKYSWMKLRNGSLRDMVPDHYRLGYMMVNYGRTKYGDSVWRKITGDAAAYKGLIYPLQHAIKKYTGEEYASFRSHAMQQFKLPVHTDSASNYGRANIHFKADEEFPQWMNVSEIVYLKTTYKNIPAFYIRNINTGEEKKLAVKDISIDNYFSYKNGKIVYASYKPDIRWGWRNYGVINILDTSGDSRIITTKTKYLCPDISADGSLVVAVNADPSGENNLHILNAATGALINEVPNKDSLVFTQPKFYNNSTIISAVRNTNGEIALASVNSAKGDYKLLTPFSFNIIGYPLVNGDTIHFTMSYQGRDRLFSIINNQVFLFNPEYPNYSTGDYHLSSNSRNYTWMMFTAAGFHTVNGSGKYEKIDLKDNEINNKLIIASNVNYVTNNYKKTFKIFNFHSWRPYISDPEYTYSLSGENILNTFLSELYFTYNRNERFKETGASFAYGGWFPVIRAGASYIFDRSFADTANTITWNEFNTNIGVSVPLSFTRGSYSQSFSAAATFNNRNVNYTGASKSRFENKQFNFADMSLSFTNQQLKALQNIYPKIAQSISLRHRFILNKYTANQFTANGSFYFPGLFPNHNIVLQGSYQGRDTLQQYNFSNIFSMSRGYSDINFPRMWRAGINYHFPIVYPDFGFGNIVYLLRVRGNAFYDYSRIKSLRTGTAYELRSTGLEIYFDSKWWNQLPVSFGIRYSRVLDGELVGLAPNQWEFVLPLTLLSR